MTIAELKPRQGKVHLECVITSKKEVRSFERDGNQGRVCNASAKDSSGEIILVLWNDEIDKVNVGSKIKVVNGYVSEYQGEKQLSAGKFGKIEIIS